MTESLYIHVASKHWLEVLESLRQENTALKYRLAEILKGRVDTVLAHDAEAFQQKLIQYDQLLALLKQDMLGFMSAGNEATPKTRKSGNRYDFYDLELDVQRTRHILEGTKASMEQRLFHH